MLEFIREYFPSTLGIVGAVGAMFLAPFAKSLVERLLSRRPAFSVLSPVMDDTLAFVVRPANAAAHRRRPLGVRVRGLILTDAAKIDPDASKLQWKVDLSNVSGIRKIFENGKDYDIQFFFKPDNVSEATIVRFAKTTSIGTSRTTPTIETSIIATTPSEFVEGIKSNSRITCAFGEAADVSRAFPVRGPNSRWESTHDGHELIISKVNKLELTGDTLVTSPRYAWVLSFEKCKNIAIRNLTLGHTKAGYCMGGVLRFDSCENLILDHCILFGSGTYGLELVDCKNVEIIGTEIRECTYGALVLERVSNVAFRNCTLAKNEGFSLVEFSEQIEEVTMQDCRIEGNSIEGLLFSFPSSSNFGFYIHNSSCTNNKFSKVSNLDCDGYFFDTFKDNTILDSAP